MATAIKLVTAFVLSICVLAWPSLTPPTDLDRLREIFLFPMAVILGAFASARRAQSLFPFAIYGLAIVAVKMYDYSSDATRPGRGGVFYRYDEIQEIVWWSIISISTAMLCCGAAVLRQRISDPRPRIEKPQRCGRCGYLLFGLTEPRCPECGEGFSLPMFGGANADQPHE